MVKDNNNFDEEGFREWYSYWSEKAGINPNPDDPRHMYDYRAAYSAGVAPEINPDDGLYHWPSQFKALDHPNRFVGGIDTITGQPVNKNMIDINAHLENLEKYGDPDSMPQMRDAMFYSNLTGIAPDKLYDLVPELNEQIKGSPTTILKKPSDSTSNIMETLGNNFLEIEDSAKVRQNMKVQEWKNYFKNMSPARYGVMIALSNIDPFGVKEYLSKEVGRELGGDEEFDMNAIYQAIKEVQSEYTVKEWRKYPAIAGSLGNMMLEFAALPEAKSIGAVGRNFALQHALQVSSGETLGERVKGAAVSGVTGLAVGKLGQVVPNPFYRIPIVTGGFMGMTALQGGTPDQIIESGITVLGFEAVGLIQRGLQKEAMKSAKEYNTDLKKVSEQELQKRVGEFDTIVRSIQELQSQRVAEKTKVETKAAIEPVKVETRPKQLTEVLTGLKQPISELSDSELQKRARETNASPYLKWYQKELEIRQQERSKVKVVEELKSEVATPEGEGVWKLEQVSNEEVIAEAERQSKFQLPREGQTQEQAESAARANVNEVKAVIKETGGFVKVEIPIEELTSRASHIDQTRQQRLSDIGGTQDAIWVTDYSIRDGKTKKPLLIVSNGNNRLAMAKSQGKKTISAFINKKALQEWSEYQIKKGNPVPQQILGILESQPTPEVKPKQQAEVKTEAVKEKSRTAEVKFPEIVGEGQTKQRKLAQRISKSIESEVVKTAAEDERYQVSQRIKVRAPKAASFIVRDPERAKRVAMGLEDSPQGIYPEDVLMGLFAKAKIEGDHQLARDLIPNAAKVGTELGRRVEAFKEIAEDTDPVGAMVDAKKTKEKNWTKRNKNKEYKKTVKEISKSIAEELKRNMPTSKDITDIIDGLQC